MAVPQIHRKKQNVQGTLEGQPEVTKMSLNSGCPGSHTSVYYNPRMGSLLALTGPLAPADLMAAIKGKSWLSLG